MMLSRVGVHCTALNWIGRDCMGRYLYNQLVMGILIFLLMILL